MSQPAVSIIMNCLNCREYLPKALASVAAQNFTDWEIIFWDNASEDNSGEIAKKFGPKLRYFRAEKTTPLGEARNLAIGQAQGRYIAFLDCDDLWEPDKLRLQLEIFKKNPAVGLVCSDTAIFDGQKTIGHLFKRGRPHAGMVYGELVKNQWISMSSAVISRQALDSVSINGKWFDERLELCEEADLFYRIAHDWELAFVEQPLTIWRVHNNNSTFRQFDKFAEETLLILEKHRALFPDYDNRQEEAVKILEDRANFQKAVSLWHSGSGKQARARLRHLLKDSRKARLFWLASFLPGSMYDTLARLYFRLPGSNP